MNTMAMAEGGSVGEGLKFEQFLDLLKLLIREPSVVGAEAPFFRVLQRELEERGARVSWYEGLLVAEGTEPESGAVSAHVDRHGLVSTGPGEFQYAAFVARNQGDLTGDSVSEQTFENALARFHGETVHAYDPWAGSYLGQGRISEVHLCPRRGNLMFRLEGLSGLLPGSPVAYLDRLEHEGGQLRGQLDNVLTVAVLVHLFELGYRGRAFFTAQEEAGRSWRFLYDWFRREGREEGRILTVDTSPFPDWESVRRQEIVLRHRDANGAFCGETVRALQEMCDQSGLRYVFKDDLIERENVRLATEGRKLLSMGRTELGRVVAASAGKISGATVQVPTTGYHTRQESASVESVRALLHLLGAMFCR